MRGPIFSPRSSDLTSPGQLPFRIKRVFKKYILMQALLHCHRNYTVYQISAQSDIRKWFQIRPEDKQVK